MDRVRGQQRRHHAHHPRPDEAGRHRAPQPSGQRGCGEEQPQQEKLCAEPAGQRVAAPRHRIKRPGLTAARQSSRDLTQHDGGERRPGSLGEQQRRRRLPPLPAVDPQHHAKREQCRDRLHRAQHAAHPDSEPPVHQELPVRRRITQGTPPARPHPQRQSGKQVHAHPDREHLAERQRGRHRAPGHRPDQERGSHRHHPRQPVGEGPAQRDADRAARTQRGRHRGDAAVEQHKVGGVPRRVRPRIPRGYAHVGAAQRRIVGGPARRGRHRVPAVLESDCHPPPVLGRDPADDSPVAVQQLPDLPQVVRKLRAVEDRGARPSQPGGAGHGQRGARILPGHQRQPDA